MSTELKHPSSGNRARGRRVLHNMDLDLDELRDDPSEPIPLPPTLTTNFLLNDDQDQSPVSSPSSSESIPPPLTPGAPTHPHVPTLSNSPHTPAGERVLIVVTSDSEIFVTVDVSGAHDPAFIRERIFTKLHIFTEEEQALVSIFRTEIGQIDVEDHEALTDEELFALCQEQGDSRGSLKFFVKCPLLDYTYSVISN